MWRICLRTVRHKSLSSVDVPYFRVTLCFFFLAQWKHRSENPALIYLYFSSFFGIGVHSFVCYHMNVIKWLYLHWPISSRSSDRERVILLWPMKLEKDSKSSWSKCRSWLLLFSVIKNIYHIEQLVPKCKIIWQIHDKLNLIHLIQSGHWYPFITNFKKM